MEPGDIDPLELDRYFTGDASIEERARIGAWLDTIPGRRAFFLEMRDGVAPVFSVTVEETQRARERLLLRTNSATTGATESKAHRISPSRVGRSWQFGAQPLRRRVLAGALATGCALLAYFSMRAPATPTTPAHRYATRIGQRAIVRLADGTRVTLAPQTQLVLDPGFGTVHRNVRLTGLAYFDVAHIAGRSFTVKTGNVTSRVLGTQFSIRHYANDANVVVAVRSGKVVSGHRTPVVLTENTVARITDSTEVVAKGADLREYIEWTNGRLVFNEARASEITTVLGQWYGLTFRITDSVMARQELSGAFDDRFARQEVLQNLQLLLGAQMTFKGNVVTLTPKRASATPRFRLDKVPTRTEVGR